MMKISIINWRFILVCSFFCLAIFAIAYKIISLQIDDSIFLKNEGKKNISSIGISIQSGELFMTEITFH